LEESYTQEKHFLIVFARFQERHFIRTKYVIL